MFEPKKIKRVEGGEILSAQLRHVINTGAQRPAVELYHVVDRCVGEKHEEMLWYPAISRGATTGSTLYSVLWTYAHSAEDCADRLFVTGAILNKDEWEEKALRSDSTMRWFDGGHLPDNLKPTVASIQGVAWAMVTTIAPSPELTVGLRKLLEAKDCFVRAKILSDEEAGEGE